jgi:hypothetical protein
MSEDTAQHPREITLELIFRQGQRILGELGQIREKQDEIITRLARVEREVVDPKGGRNFALPPRTAGAWWRSSAIAGPMEREVVDLRRDILGLHEDYVSLAGRLDNLDRRVARIEHRLDLVDESTSSS